MKTRHRLVFADSKKLDFVGDGEIALVVTSPPYPMIGMWDETFSRLDGKIPNALREGRAQDAFDRMHAILDRTWEEIARVVMPGGIVCINIGDATRKIHDRFRLYSNHVRIVDFFLHHGFDAIPQILWRKQTNAPTKFMGSGMLPPGAYVTLEHEHILIFRKGDKRNFCTPEEKENRRKSAYFWEERNNWFSDVWFDIKGTTQKTGREEIRKRSGAFPFELAYRLVNMFSVKDDTVLDPFLGTGTTTLAAMASERNSVGVEIDPSFLQIIHEMLENATAVSNSRIEKRFADHMAFVKNRKKEDKPVKYENIPHGFPVMTNQEKMLRINELKSVQKNGNATFEVSYRKSPRSFAENGAENGNGVWSSGEKPVSVPEMQQENDAPSHSRQGFTQPSLFGPSVKK